MGETKINEFQIAAEIANLDEVLNFVDEQLESMECTPKARMQLDMAVEEMFVNIASYAYGGESGPAWIRMWFREEGKMAVVELIDRGVPYDPLAKEDPDVTLSLEKRAVGGLGIFMVKKSVDRMRYNYEDGCNIVTLEKRIAP
jgi:anti-sigma regulatory factor (Ser/Thr protein kinase)